MYDPATKQTHCIADTFYFANGVALAADESYVLVAETDRIRINKIWLTGSKVRSGRTHAPAGPPLHHAFPDDRMRAAVGGGGGRVVSEVEVVGSPVGKAPSPGAPEGKGR